MQIRELQPRAIRLGYRIGTPRTQALADRWDSVAYIRTWHPGARYFTAPIRAGGPWNYFKTLPEIERYLDQVEQVRRWQDTPQGALSCAPDD